MDLRDKRARQVAAEPVSVGQPREIACTVCGAKGTPGPEWSPYLGCNGDPARHTRTPVGA